MGEPFPGNAGKLLPEYIGQ